MKPPKIAVYIAALYAIAVLLMAMAQTQAGRIAKLEARVHQLTEMVAPNLLIGESK